MEKTLIVNVEQKCEISFHQELLYEERMLTNPADIALALNIHYCSISDRLSNSISDTGNDYKQFLANNLRGSFFLESIDEADILREIKKI